MLNGLPILIVEDAPLVGEMLAVAIEDVKGRAIGPISTVAQALILIQSETIAAAILDANVLDGCITPVAEMLIGIQVPFVVHTGTGLPRELAKKYPDIPVIMKPAPTTAVLAALLQQVSPDRSRFE